MAERGRLRRFADEDEHERPYHAGANHADEHPPEEEPKLRWVFFLEVRLNFLIMLFLYLFYLILVSIAVFIKICTVIG